MTPEELYRYDINGHLLIEDAIAPPLLRRLNQRVDAWKAAGLARLAAAGRRIDAMTGRHEDRIPSGAEPGPAVDYTRGDMRIDDILNHEESLLDLVDNPRLLPYLRAMIDGPRLKSTWLTFRWRDGATTGHGNHTPTISNSFSFFHGRPLHHLLNVMYALDDIEPGGGGLEVIPGSHRANYPIPPGMDLSPMLVEQPMRAGSMLLFAHDIYHASLNRSGAERRILMFTYCPGIIANSLIGDTLYDRLFAQATEDSWRKYLLRRPSGLQDTYPQPPDMAVVDPLTASARG